MGILEAGFASHIERAFHIRILERGIATGHGQTFIHIYGFLECRLSSGGERAVDLGILEAGFTSHIERTERGIACDRERLIHGHVALEVRCIFHVQRACVHSARRGDIASASIHAFACQLAIRSHIAFRLHIAKVIDSHIVFDRSFVSNVIAFDSGGALIGVSDSVTIGLNVICIRLDIALCRCHFAIQRCDIFSVLSDFFFQRGVSCFALISFCLDCIRYVFYLFLGRNRSPREALAVDAIGFDFIGFYVRKPGNRTIAITNNVSIFYSNTINASSSPISIRNIGGLLLQIFNSRILFTSCCF